MTCGASQTWRNHAAGARFRGRVRLGHGWKKVPIGGPHLSVTRGRRTRSSVEEQRGGAWRTAARLVRPWAGRARGLGELVGRQGGKKRRGRESRPQGEGSGPSPRVSEGGK